MAVGSFSAGLSGLNANAAYLSVIGNNLANINTIGFKSSSVAFSDLVSQTVAGSSANPMQIGLGVVVGAISPIFSQGAIENSREATSVAIQGNGFFLLRGSDGQSYTRAGNFTFDSNGALVAPDGHFVQGYTATDPLTGAIVTTGQPTDITIPPGALRSPIPTTLFSTQTNLDAAVVAGNSFTTSVQMYDALGQSHLATITYTKAAANTWSYAITVPGAEVTGGTAGTPFPIPAASNGVGTMTFDSAGKLTTIAVGTGAAAAPVDFTITTPTWTNGAAASSWTWDMVDANGNASMTGFFSPSATSSISQNGSAPGQVDNISISSDGTIQATVGGLTVALAQIAVAKFNNPKGLTKVGTNRYVESQPAGIPNVGVAGTGGRGSLIGSALEQSNVDIAQEFTQMILAQRGYQANSKTITVSDELLVDTLQLKR